MDAVGFSLFIMLAAPGRKASWLPMSDYDSAAQCELAREATLAYWHATRGPEYRVKLEAECIIIAGASSGDQW